MRRVACQNPVWVSPYERCNTAVSRRVKGGRRFVVIHHQEFALDLPAQPPGGMRPSIAKYRTYLKTCTQPISARHRREQQPFKCPACQQRPNPLPTATSSFTLERPRQFWCDPSAIKTARLRNNPGTAHAALEIVRVKSDALSQRLCPGQGSRIAPGDLCQPLRTVDQIPIPRRAFPLAERAASCVTQQRMLNISQRQVESGWVRGLSRCPGGACSSHLK